MEEEEHALKFYHGHRRIIQIMPADGWYFVQLQDDEEGKRTELYKERIAGFALVEEAMHAKKGWDAEANIITSVVPLGEQGGYLEAIKEYSELYHESEPWSEFLKRTITTLKDGTKSASGMGMGMLLDP